jgi:hypothetical protein
MNGAMCNGESKMKITIQIVVEHESLPEPITEEVACLCRGDLVPENLGLTLAEGKALLAQIQEKMVTQQAAVYGVQQRPCPHCHQPRRNKGSHQIIWRSLFGKIHLHSPRLYTCDCQPQLQKSVSPLAQLLAERTAPEFKYLQSKWASLMSYGLSVKLLEEVLPLEADTTTVQRHTLDVAEKLEAELGEEQYMYVDMCERDWEALPDPAPPLTVGIDGGYVHARDGDNRKAGWFEIIVGKSMQEEAQTKRLAFVNDYDQKPKRRLYEMLQTQGLQMNQDIIFLSDGGDTVRDLQLDLSPQAEHLLDWFHVTMRITAIQQMARGLPTNPALPDILSETDSIKWYLWHGNVFDALQRLESLDFDLECYEGNEALRVEKVWQAIQDFQRYITVNEPFIPNYGERYRYGEKISTAFVESTVNEVISKRMVKKQQMRWTKRGAHLVLQVRTTTLDGDLRNAFRRWFPNMTSSTEIIPLAA